MAKLIFEEILGNYSPKSTVTNLQEFTKLVEEDEHHCFFGRGEHITIGIYEVPTKEADSGASPEGLAEKLREFVGTFKFIGAFRKSSCTTQVTYTKFTSR